MKSIKNKLQLFRDMLMFPYVIIRLFLNPTNIEPIFKLGTLRDHKSFSLAKDKIMADPEMAAMVKEQFLMKEKIDVDALSKLPAGTLGNEFARFITERNLKVDFYKEYNDSMNDDFAYARKRCPQTHDIWHVVIGVDAEPLGEMKICAFYVAQIRSPFNALYVGIGLFVALFKKPEMLEQFFEAVTEGWLLGKKAKPLFAQKWEHLWEKNLAELRTELNLPAIPQGVATITSQHPSMAASVPLQPMERGEFQAQSTARA